MPAALPGSQPRPRLLPRRHTLFAARPSECGFGGGVLSPNGIGLACYHALALALCLASGRLARLLCDVMLTVRKIPTRKGIKIDTASFTFQSRVRDTVLHRCGRKLRVTASSEDRKMKCMVLAPLRRPALQQRLWPHPKDTSHALRKSSAERTRVTLYELCPRTIYSISTGFHPCSCTSPPRDC